MRRLFPALIALTAACAVESAAPFDESGVRAMAAGIARDLATEGPEAWLHYFLLDSSFFMASDGAFVFPDADAARTFIRSFDSAVTSMDLRWDSVRVQRIGDSAASLAMRYQESILDTAGNRSEFAGLFSGVAVGTRDGWKLQHAHWSRAAGEGQERK